MAAAEKFSRFGDKRKITSDTAGYDDYVEGVEADEVTSLETPLPEDNRGFKLIQRMGWQSGTGLGKFKQGRKEPVSFELKDNHMGLGRWTMELEQAQETTERRRQLEVEKELTEDLLEQYKAQAEKDRKLVETLTNMNKAFYCDTCDRQYTKYSEFDNHINSYSHHHQQRLRSLKEYETGRKFGGHRTGQEEKDKMLAAQMVAIERAQMRARQQKRQVRGGHVPGFKPIGGGVSESIGHAFSTSVITGIKRSATTAGSGGSSTDKLTEKKSKLAKFGLKFQSAGTLMSIGEQIGKDTPIQKDMPISSHAMPTSHLTTESNSSSTRRLAKYTTAKWDKEGDFEKRCKLAEEKEHAIRVEKAPPPLKSRQRELIMENYADGSEEEEEFELTAKSIIKKPTKFKFNLGGK